MYQSAPFLYFTALIHSFGMQTIFLNLAPKRLNLSNDGYKLSNITSPSFQNVVYTYVESGGPVVGRWLRDREGVGSNPALGCGGLMDSVSASQSRGCGFDPRPIHACHVGV